MAHQTVLVIDFGGQYTQLIVRRVRELGVYSEMVPWTTAEDKIRSVHPAAVILSGGPRSVLEPGAPTIDFGVLKGIPVLGICYGQQLMAHYLGGRVETSERKEYGYRIISTSTVTPGYGGLGARLSTAVIDEERSDTPETLRVDPLKSQSTLVDSLTAPTVWMSHGDQVLEVPPGFIITAHTDSCPVAAMEDFAAAQYGVQFHPEVSHTPGGRALLDEFLVRAGLTRDWSAENFIDEEIGKIRATVGETGKVLCAVSGGVDSSVMAALLIKAIGERAVCVFVDHGLLRKGEAQQVVDTFAGHFKANLKAFTEHDLFFGALRGVKEPEAKRKIIGEQFVRVFEDHAKELRGCDFLAQGTLYPDVIESGSPTAAKIKTHHNVGGLPDWMKMKLIEPLRWLFKDEVREVGRRLGLPAEIVDREPFPGPGLGVRVLGEVTADRVRMVQEADWIFRSVLRENELHFGIWQSYAALLDVKSVGVMGDERTYEQPIVLRAVESEDAMTARAVNIPFEVLEHIATRIVNEVDGVNRVFYDLTSKPPATIELE
ncbi:MAG: glutamine-hydrolyzing GMP synthase [Fimbriimonadales bacterium]